MSAQRLPLTEDELPPPSDEDVRGALAEFAKVVRNHYGAKVQDLYLFGSRARGDNRPNSDADVAVVLADGDWVDWRERSELVRLAYEPSLDSGLLIQPWPIPASMWGSPGEAASAFVRRAARDAIVLEVAP